MRKLLLTLLVAVAAAGPTQAGEVALTGLAGYALPFYSQAFLYGPGSVSVVEVPNLSLEQSGSFQLKASGGVAFGGAIAFYPTAGFGLELRLDSAAAEIGGNDSTFNVKATLPGAAPDEETLTLPDGSGSLDSLQPVSFNLKLRTTGTTKLFVSGGASRMGSSNLTVLQNVALGVSEVNLITGNLRVSTLDLLADQSLEASFTSWGGNLGLGVEIPLGEHAGLVLEGRGFYFGKQQVEWKAVTPPAAGTIEAQLLERAARQPLPGRVRAVVGAGVRRHHVPFLTTRGRYTLHGQFGGSYGALTAARAASYAVAP